MHLFFVEHCEKPECVFTCMTGAMHKDKETGYVTYDSSKCASCYMCDNGLSLWRIKG